MDTRTPRLGSVALVAGFVLLCLMIALLLWRSFGGATPLQPRGYEVGVAVPDALNLAPNADVRIAGVNVGKVRRVARERNLSVVTVQIEPEYAPLREGSRVIVRTKTLLGEPYLEMTRGVPRAPLIPDGARLPMDAVSPAQRLDEALAAFDRPTRARMRRLTRLLAQGVDGRGDDINASLGWVQPTTADLAAVARTLDGQRDDIRALLANGSVVLGAVGARSGEVQTIVRAGNRVLSATASQQRALTATVRALPRFITELEATSNTATAASPDIARAARSLRAVSPAVPAALEAVRTAGPVASDVLAGLPAVAAASERGLPAATRLVDRLVPAFDEVYPALREVIPVLQLLSVNRDSVVGALANVGGVLNGKSIAPGGHVISTAPGIPTIWNEAIAGYKKKLPTNRSNPYPAPGSARDIARGGLKAFDCRNLGNTAFVPAFGDVPPCRVQGPWTFNGKSAFFPRLMPAPK